MESSQLEEGTAAAGAAGGSSASPAQQHGGHELDAAMPQLRIRTQPLQPLQQQPLQDQRQPHYHHHQAVEMSAVRHFGRSASFEALVSASADWDDELSSTDTEEEEHERLLLGLPGGAAAAGDAAAAGAAGGSVGGGAPWGSRAGSSCCGFEPFEVEERATELKVLREAHAKKERECEHLRQIIKELSVSRARVHKAKVDLEEQFGALQKEYYRVIKVSDLARTVSQQAVARASGLKGELAAAQDQARRSRRRAAAADAKATALADDNARLRQRLALLESLRAGSGAADEFRPSACAREFMYSQSVSLY